MEITKAFLNLSKVLLCLLSLMFSTYQKVMCQEYEVNAYGAFNYKYEIILPTAINNLGPKLDLVYNSNSGNGMLGMGWTLSGIPVITRDPAYGIRYDNIDHYLYNGEKLIPDNTGMYHTERETFVKIEAKELNTASSYWMVTLKDGTKMFFGYSETVDKRIFDGHINAVGKGEKAYLWSLNKVVDVKGNYYTIEYNEDLENGDYYPVRIIYTKNDSQPSRGATNSGIFL